MVQAAWANVTLGGRPWHFRPLQAPQSQSPSYLFFFPHCRRHLFSARWVSHLLFDADSASMDNHPSPDFRSHFPSHTEPRVWLITAGDSPIGISVARQVLAHGDYALLGLAHSVLDRDERRRNGFDAFLAEIEEHRDEGWKQRTKTVPLDIRFAPPLLCLSGSIRPSN